MADPVSQFATRMVYGARQLPRVAWYIGHGMVMRRLRQAVRERGGGPLQLPAGVRAPARRPLDPAVALLLRAAPAHGGPPPSPPPADHDGTLPDLLARSRLFFQDLPDIHRRREKGDIREVLS